MITMISYFNRNNRHAYNRSMFIFSTRFSNSSSFTIELNNMPINIIRQEIFNNSNIRCRGSKSDSRMGGRYGEARS